VNRVSPPPPPADDLVSLADIEAAAERIRPFVARTPMLPLGSGAWLKAENFQPTGSFKIRGASNALAQLPPERRAAGVVTHSSGNHAQAIARAARRLGIRALVVMPDNAPAIKVAGVRADGAEIVFVGPANEERVARAHRLADEQGLELVSSANDKRIVAGQGTLGLEILEQLAELGESRPPTIVLPLGLGGLAAGVATAVKSRQPAARIVGVEPALAADTRASLAAGERVSWPAEQVGRTVADGLRGEAPAAIPFAHLRRYLDEVVTVEETQIVAAVRRAALELKLVLEPSGAVTLAAYDAGAVSAADGPLVVVGTGGNIDPQRLIEFLRD
jgi:threonine dehydratase